MSATTDALKARLAAKQAAAATRVPDPSSTVTGGSDNTTPTEKKITGPRREVVWVKYPPVGFDVGTEWELVPIVKKSQARLNHAAGYSMVDLVRPLKANVTMKVVAICKEADRSIQVEVIL